MSTLNLPIGVSPFKRSRKPIQDSQRKALRTWYYDDSNQISMKRFKLKACSRWWQQIYDYHLSSFIASEIISFKWARLNNEAISEWRDTKRHRNSEWSALKETLFEWEQRYERVKNIVTKDVLCIKVTQFWERLLCYQNLSILKWIDNWLTDFKSRHSLKDRKLHDEVDDADLNSQTFTTMKEIRAENKNYNAEDIFNMNEMKYFWKSTLNRSLFSAEFSDKKQNKKRITINLCFNVIDSRKLQFWFIETAAHLNCFWVAHIFDLKTLEDHWRFNAKTWMIMNVLMIQYLRWFDRQMIRSTLLLMNDFAAHKLAIIKLLQNDDDSLHHTKIMWLLVNATFVHQSLNQNIIQNWKSYVWKQQIQFMIECFNADLNSDIEMNVLRAIRWDIFV